MTMYRNTALNDSAIYRDLNCLPDKVPAYFYALLIDRQKPRL